MAKLSTALRLDTRTEENENIKYSICSKGNRAHDLSRLQSHACVPAPRLSSNIKIINNIQYDVFYSIMVDIVKEQSLEEEYKKTGIRPADVAALRDWLKTQPHLPEKYITG